MAELEELIGEMKSSQQFNALEMEFVHTRAKGVLQLLQLLDPSEEPVIPKSDEGNRMLEKLKEKVEKVSRLTSEIEPVAKEEETEEDKGEENDREQTLPGVVPEPAEKEQEEEDPGTDEKPSYIKEESNDDEMLQEETIKSDAGSRLGDSFLKSKSVNDLITDQVKLEFKLSNRPVNNIQAAIGINDRFQYIRELFDGDNKKFLETVKTLDSMDNIREAIDYLRNNFKWKKNETSLKFVNLVKRRFQDSTSDQ